MKNYLIIILLLTASCAPIPSVVPTSTRTESAPALTFSPTPKPTFTPTLMSILSPSKTVQPTLDFQTYDLRWCISDAEGDVGITHIDVVKVDAIARGETFIAKIFVKSIPKLLTFNRDGVPPDKLEYSWEIWIDIDGNAKVDSTEYGDFADYDLSIMHFVFPEDGVKTSSLAEGTQQNIWKNDSVEQRWHNIDDATMEIDYSVGTITIIGNIPGLNPKSKIAFSTFDYNPGYQKQEDNPDSVSMVPPNTACTRRVGVAAFSGTLRGLKLVPFKLRCLVPPTRG